MPRGLPLYTSISSLTAYIITTVLLSYALLIPLHIYIFRLYYTLRKKFAVLQIWIRLDLTYFVRSRSQFESGLDHWFIQKIVLKINKNKNKTLVLENLLSDDILKNVYFKVSLKNYV